MLISIPRSSVTRREVGKATFSDPELKPWTIWMLKSLFVLAMCYVCQNMVGEWAWPEEAGETKLSLTNNNILGHVVVRLRKIVQQPIVEPSSPSVLHFTFKACVLGKFCSGKTTCLAKIAKGTGLSHHLYMCFLKWYSRIGCRIRWCGLFVAEYLCPFVL